MLFDLTKASNDNYREEIELNSIEDLLNFLKTYPKVIIQNFGEYIEIKIYDDYVE